MKPISSTRPRFPRWPGSAPAAREQGFSIIEAMVGFLVLGIVIAALCSGFSFGFNAIKLSQEDVRADQILVQKLDTLRIYDWSKITNNFIPTNFTAYYSTSNAIHGVTYTGTVSVARFAATGESYSNTLRQVTATVSWFSEGQPHSRTMTTLVSQKGLLTYTP